MVFLFAEVPSSSFFFDDYSHSDKNTTFFGIARADTVKETPAVLVDCVLPGKVRPFGSTTYVTREKIIKTTRQDCAARGGQPMTPAEPEAEITDGAPAAQTEPSSADRGQPAD